MGQKIVKFHNETPRLVQVSNWAVMERSQLEVLPLSVENFVGDYCAYTVTVKDGDFVLRKHGVYWPLIDWIIYYEDQKEICHLLAGTGEAPSDISEYLYFEIPDHLL